MKTEEEIRAKLEQIRRDYERESDPNTPTALANHVLIIGLKWVLEMEV